MSIKDIITVPDETLKKISKPIEKVGENEKKLIKDLFETMYNSNGIGLAGRLSFGCLFRGLRSTLGNELLPWVPTASS
ncbi:MAG: hypothetical protein CBD47_03320 [Synechococcus sp. TMED187]|nr:MAG: hypothetical protein CBD47_03320 [Synechococcus sp. TMED187]